MEFHLTLSLAVTPKNILKCLFAHSLSTLFGRQVVYPCFMPFTGYALRSLGPTSWGHNSGLGLLDLDLFL